MTWLSFFLFFKFQRMGSPTNSRCPRRWRYEGTTWICRFVKKTLRYPVIPLRVKYICAVYIHIYQLLDPYGKYLNVLLKLDIALAEFVISKCVVTTTHPNYLWCIHRLYIYIPRFLFWDARPTFGIGELHMFFPEWYHMNYPIITIWHCCWLENHFILDNNPTITLVASRMP